ERAVAHELQGDPDLLPRSQQRLDPLFGGESPNEDDVASVVLPRSGVRIDEVWLHGDLFRRKPTLDKLSLHEACDRYIHVHRAAPGPEPAVRCQHGGDWQSLGPRTTITAVQHAWPGYGLAQAVLADAPVPQQRGGRAEQTLLM